MPATRIRLAGAIALALAAGLVPAASAQSDEVVYDDGPFFAEFDDVTLGESAWEPGPGYGRLIDWEVVYEDVVATDPRLSGTWSVLLNGHGFGQPGTAEAFGVYTGTARLGNADGAWVGEAVSFQSEPYERIRLIVEGEGAYEGLAAVIDQADQDWSGFRGIVFGGGLPPMPEPIEP